MANTTTTDEREITMTRELVYDIVKKHCNLSNIYDRKVYKRLSQEGFDYEDESGFDNCLRLASDATLEWLLLDM